jgi:hypothetical protein
MTTGGRSADGDVQGFAAVSTGPSLPSSATLRRRRRFFRHLIAYVAGNLVLLAVWLVVGVTTDSWFFWPVFVLAGWGLLLDVHAWRTYGRPSIERAPDR